jgi:hypothetical protein
MRRVGVWKFEIALLVGVGMAAPAWAQEPEDREPLPPRQTGWRVAPWLQEKMPPDPPPPPPKKKPAPKPDKPAAEAPAPARPMAAVDRAALERAREEKDFLRRLRVCDTLVKIAQENRDEQLERRAEQLNQRAWAIYQQRIAHLPCSNAQPELDEAVLERHLGTAAAPGERGLYPGEETPRGSRAALQEVRP